MTWPIKKLGEVCEIARGGSPRPIQNYLTEDSAGINWIKIGDATSSDKYIFNTKERIKKEGLRKTRLVESGDLILTNSMSFGHPYIMGTSGAIHDGWLLLRPCKEVWSEYLYYFLSSNGVYDEFSRLAGGAVVKNLNSKSVATVEIPLPSLFEQKKIVARLEKMFGKIKEAKRLRAEAQEATQKLLSAELHKIFEEGKKKGWEEKKLEKVCKINMGQSPSSSTYNQNQKGLPFFQGKKDYGETYPTPRVWCSNPIKIVDLEDILISVRAPVGALNVARERSCIGRGLAGLRADSELDQAFLFYFLKFKQKEIENKGTGSTFKAISKKDLEGLIVYLPSVSEQKKIVTRLDALSEKIKKLQEYQKQTESDLIALEKSILHNAFNGKL